jgi:hypothetical protein
MAPSLWNRCIAGWANVLSGKIIVDRGGISIRELSFFKAYEVLFAFEEIRKIKVRGSFIKIEDELSPGWMLAQDPGGFIEAVKKYAPDKLEVK